MEVCVGDCMSVYVYMCTKFFLITTSGMHMNVYEFHMIFLKVLHKKAHNSESVFNYLIKTTFIDVTFVNN